MRGRKPTPLNIKMLRGNPGKRALNMRAPQPGGMPTCPEWLSLEAKREWHRVLPQLKRLGLVAAVDRAALALYCQAWARFRQAEQIIEEKGQTFSQPILREGTDEKGQPFVEVIGEKVKPRPEVSIAARYYQIIRAMLTEFGLTPSSRGRMTVPGQEEKDELNALLG